MDSCFPSFWPTGYMKEICWPRKRKEESICMAMKTPSFELQALEKDDSLPLHQPAASRPMNSRLEKRRFPLRFSSSNQSGTGTYHRSRPHAWCPTHSQSFPAAGSWLAAGNPFPFKCRPAKEEPVRKDVRMTHYALVSGWRSLDQAFGLQPRLILFHT